MQKTNKKAAAATFASDASGKRNTLSYMQEKVTAAMSLPKEVALDLPIVTITGRNEIFIENFKNLLEFADNKIRLRIKDGTLTVEGKDLTLKQITSENLLITGTVVHITYD